MVEYHDGSVIAQLGAPDMRTPIACALAWPERIEAGVAPVDFAALGRLEFGRVDDGRFPCVRLAFSRPWTGEDGPGHPQRGQRGGRGELPSPAASRSTPSRPSSRTSCRQARSNRSTRSIRRGARTASPRGRPARDFAPRAPRRLKSGRIGTMSGALVTIASFLVTVGVLVVIHEWGHFAVARLAGVKILRFSVGFGRPLWIRRLGPDRTEWAIAAFPLGGFVKMLDSREGEVAPSERSRAFDLQPVGKRIAIVLAGPAANFIAAFFLYWGSTSRACRA